MRPTLLDEALAAIEDDGQPAPATDWYVLFGQTSSAARLPLLLVDPGPSPRLASASFDPAQVVPVIVPAGWRLVLAGTGEEHGPASDLDLVTVGLRLAATMLADQVGIDLDQPPTLAQVADIDVVEILVDDLPDRISAREVAHGAGVDLEQLVRAPGGRVDPTARIAVRKVARHALTEAARVAAAVAAIQREDLDGLGRLFDEGHNSLRQDAAASTPALDRLCAAMRKAGATGARAVEGQAGPVAIALVSVESEAAVQEAARATSPVPSRGQ